MSNLHRRAFLKMLGMGLTTLRVGAVLAEDEKPKITNILLLYVDDLRPEINCYGKSKIVSPNMDKLAAHSLVYNKAYCQVPVCGPSRVSTLSGMYPRSTGQWNARDFLSKGLPSLPGISPIFSLISPVSVSIQAAICSSTPSPLRSPAEERDEPTVAPSMNPSKTG